MKGAFAVKPEGFDGRTKAGKEWAADQGDKVVLSQRHADMIARMADTVWKHPEANAIISGSEREKSLFVNEGAIWLKGRLDCLTKSGNIIADLKTCELCDLASVEKAIFTYGYYRQAAIYLRLANALGLNKSRFVFIFVEKTPPHCVALYSLTDDALKIGEMETDASIRLLKFCTDEGRWPGRESGVNEASMPEWALKQLASVL
jgi:hypothetical protein